MVLGLDSSVTIYLLWMGTTEYVWVNLDLLH